MLGISTVLVSTAAAIAAAGTPVFAFKGENLDEYRAHVRVAFLIEGKEVE